MRSDPVTKQEVKQALEAATERASWRPATRTDVAREVAKARGCFSANEELSVIRRYVSIGQVSTRLEELAASNEAYMLKGDHVLIANRYHVRRGATYYLSPRARDLAISDKSRRWRERMSDEADKFAFERFTEDYSEEYGQHRQTYFSQNPEPVWSEM